MVGGSVGAVVCSLIGNEVRAPRLLEPFPEAELPAVCRTCHQRFRPPRLGLHVNRSLLRGHCPTCKHPASRVPVLAELAVIAMGALVGWRITNPGWLPAYLLFGFVLVAVVFVDGRLHLISTKLVYPSAVAALGVFVVTAAISGEPERLKWMLIGGLGASAFIWLLWIVYPAGMGPGDARLSLFLGMFLGWLGWRHVVIGIFLGFLLGSMGGLVLVGFRRAGFKSQLAFGPYLALGALLVVLWPSLATWFAPAY